MKFSYIFLSSLSLFETALYSQSKDVMTFTIPQAERGREVYISSCAACHGVTLQGGPEGLPLVGRPFLTKWKAQPGNALFDFIKNRMPPGNPGNLSAGNYADLAAFVLQANGARPGPKELPADSAALAQLVFPVGASSAGPRTAQLSAPRSQSGQGDAKSAPDTTAQAALDERAARLARLRPVTDDMLRNPPAGSWLSWRRDQAATGYSDLSQINRRNVAKLRTEWSWALKASWNEITPIVHDGVMFIASGGRVQALDATNGEVLWEYAHPAGTPEPMKNMAIAGNRLFYASSNNHIVALDIHTGKVIWNHVVVPPESGLQLTSGPLYAHGKLIQGVTRCYLPYKGGCFIVALDAETGEESWRFHTIAQPGQTGGDSWNGVPADQRQGGSVWTTGSYDPDLDLVYFGVANTYKTSVLLEPGEGRGGNNSGLYTASTLALRPGTGELVWHFQHHRREVWNLDWAFERTLATLNIQGTPRRTVTTAGKLGIFDTLDAATGQYLFSNDMGIQTLIEAVDPVTGEKKVRPEFTPEANVEKLICPSTYGGRNWNATAFNPKSAILYVPAAEACMQFTWQPGGDHDVRGQLVINPKSGGLVGRLQAIDMIERKTLWTARQRSAIVSAALATGGYLVFEGSRDRMFRARDDKTGKILWQIRLDSPPSSFPITYMVDGVQYVAVVAGGGNFFETSVGDLTQEFGSTKGGGTTLWVFRLPGKMSRER